MKGYGRSTHLEEDKAMEEAVDLKAEEGTVGVVAEAAEDEVK